MDGPDGPMPLDTLEVEGETLRLGREGYRVLAVAKGPLPVAGAGAGSLSGSEPLSDSEQVPPLTLLGLVGFIDPLRPEVQAAIATCRQRRGACHHDHRGSPGNRARYRQGA